MSFSLICIQKIMLGMTKCRFIKSLNYVGQNAKYAHNLYYVKL